MGGQSMAVCVFLLQATEGSIQIDLINNEICHLIEQEVPGLVNSVTQ
jgi:hypothetical protein